MVKLFTLRAEGLGFESRLRHEFPGFSHTNNLKTGTPVPTLPGAWYYRVSAGAGWPGISILWLGVMESLICNFYLSMVAHTVVWTDPLVRYTSMLLGCRASNQQTESSKYFQLSHRAGKRFWGLGMSTCSHPCTGCQIYSNFHGNDVSAYMPMQMCRCSYGNVSLGLLVYMSVYA